MSTTRVNRCPTCSTPYPGLRPVDDHTRCTVCDALSSAKLDEAAARLLADLAESAGNLPDESEAKASQHALERGARALTERSRNWRHVAHRVSTSLEPHRRRRRSRGAEA